MSYFLPNELEGFLVKGDDQTGEHRGGKYAARVQIGIEKDGSPRYRYFQTQEQYESYLEGRGGKKKQEDAHKKKQSDKLSTAVSKERKESKKKQDDASPRKKGEEKRKRSLLKDKPDAKKQQEEANKKEKTEKSLSLYLGVR